MNDRAVSHAQRSLAGMSPAVSSMRRRCACGTHTPGGGQCPACKKHRLAGSRQDDAVDAAVAQLPSASSGPVSGADARSALGRDFARMPLHAGGTSGLADSTPRSGELASLRHARNPKGTQPPPKTKPADDKTAKGAAPDYRSRVKNVKLTLGAAPKVALSHDEKLIKLTLDDYLVGAGEADVEGKGDCDKFQFGFIQLCRPFDMERIVYGLRDTPNTFIASDSSTEIRAAEPALDVFNVGDVFSYQATPACKGGGKTFHAKVDYSDKPGTGMVMATPKTYAQGIAWQDFFFTTFSVIYPDGTVEHLKSFYWEIKFCLQIDPPTASDPDGKVKSKTSDVKVGNPIDGVPAEPGLALMGRPATKTCNAVVKGATPKVDVTKAPVSC
ncbi:hypothetical protein [Rhodanobacter ginsengiterrae]|uniref:hypothetical protein n=1 Tax=Rhodanobacter ginsengiterrae TaxID=2008451 RepID=UPI003CEA871D